MFSFLRYDGDGQMIACITNFSSEPRPDHRLGLPTEGVWKEILNTDAEVYDGTGHIGNLGQVVAAPVPSHGYPASASVTIPPLGAVWLRFEPVSTEEQPEPDKVAAGVRAAARAASPHPRRPCEDDARARGRRAARGSGAAGQHRAAGADAHGRRQPAAEEPLVSGPPDPVAAPAVSDPMASAEAAAPVPSSSPDSPDSPDSPARHHSPESPDSPPPTVR